MFKRMVKRMIKNSERPYLVKVIDYSTVKNLNVNYTNETGRTLVVLVSCIFETLVNTDFATVRGYVDGVSVAHGGIPAPTVSKLMLQVSVFVPPGSVYRFESYDGGSGHSYRTRWIEAY